MVGQQSSTISSAVREVTNSAGGHLGGAGAQLGGPAGRRGAASSGGTESGSMRAGATRSSTPGHQLGVHRHRPLDQRQRHRPQLVVQHDGADPADRAAVAQHRVPGHRQLLVAGVQVQQHQPARRPAEVRHPGHRLLAAVAALGQVHRRADPADLVRDRPVVGVHAQPGPRRPRPAAPRRPSRRPGRAPRRGQPVPPVAPARRAAPAGPPRPAPGQRIRRTSPPPGSAPHSVRPRRHRHAGRGQHRRRCPARPRSARPARPVASRGSTWDQNTILRR